MASFPFPDKISQASSAVLDQKVSIAQYGDGYQQRAAIGINSMWYTWAVTTAWLNLTERNTMNAFYAAHGRVQSFDWTPPNGTAGKYVFVEPLRESNSGIYYTYEMTIMQVFE